MAGCASTKEYEKNDQYLFTKVTIKGNKKIDTDALTNLLQQKPNRSLFGATPYLWFYQRGLKLFDKKKALAKVERTRARYDAKIAKLSNPKSAKAQRLRNLRDDKVDKLTTNAEEGNFLMRKLGEPPSLFDASAMAQTAREMRNYLFNKGFFDGQVSANLDTHGRKIHVTYTIAEGPPQLVRKVRYFAYSKSIQNLLDSLATHKPVVKKGDRYDQDRIIEERDLIDKVVRNSGFYAFSRDYIFVEADTGVTDSTYGSRAVDMVFKIKDPTRGEHEKYRVSEVEFHITNKGGFARTDTTVTKFEQITYVTPYRKLAYRILDSKILIRPGQFYNLDALNKSQAQLQLMDIFRFVNFSFDTISDNNFRLNIQASRLPKYQISDELGVLVSQGAPGPFANIGFKVRNGLNMFDIFEISGRYSEEGQLSFATGNSVYRAREIGINSTITFPAIVFPGRVSYLFNSRNPKTRLQLGYTDLRRPEYSQNIARATLGYSANLSDKEVVGLNLIDASVVYSFNLAPKFSSYLLDQQRRGNSLIQSFNDQVVTSLSTFYVYNTSSQTVKKEGVYLRLFAEWGGEVPNLFATTQDKVANEGTIVSRGRYIKSNPKDLQVFRFSKLQADFRYYYPTSKRTMWVGRINTGVAVPRGDNTVLPYVKYFFTGGSNSNRAWAPRRLGPGTYTIPLDSFQAEQPGEILIEANVELRHKLFGFVEGALFADLGNVFTLRAEEGRPGSQFKVGTFLPSLALGTGAGLRLDFSFLVVRLDAGIKTYDPSREKGSRWVISDLKFGKRADKYQQVLLNIGIGYPF